MQHEVLTHLLFQMLARCRGTPGRDAFCDRILHRVEGAVGTLAFGEVEADVREKLDRGIEQHDPVDAFGCELGQFEDEPAAERMADPLWHCEPPCASRVSSTSCAWVAKVQGGSTPELPWPRRSGASTRKRPASRFSASLRKRRPCAFTPWRQTTGGAGTDRPTRAD